MKILNKASIFLITLLVATFASCELETTIDYNAKDTKPFLVMFSHLNPDSAFSANIDIARHILDTTTFTDLSNSEVNVYEDDILLEKLKLSGSNSFKGTKMPKLGRTYKITVANKNYQTIEASAVVMKKPVIANLQNIPNYSIYSKLRFQFELNDPIDEKNYYRLLAFEIWDFTRPLTESYIQNHFSSYEQVRIVGNKVIRQLRLSSDQAIFAFLEDGNPNAAGGEDFPNRYMIFNDETINGQNYKVVFEASYSHASPNDTMKIYYTFSLHNISKDYYLFLQTGQNQFIHSYDPFVEPIQIHTNVKNGAGIFGSYSSQELSLDADAVIKN